MENSQNSNPGRLAPGSVPLSPCCAMRQHLPSHIARESVHCRPERPSTHIEMTLKLPSLRITEKPFVRVK